MPRPTRSQIRKDRGRPAPATDAGAQLSTAWKSCWMRRQQRDPLDREPIGPNESGANNPQRRTARGSAPTAPDLGKSAAVPTNLRPQPPIETETPTSQRCPLRCLPSRHSPTDRAGSNTTGAHGFAPPSAPATPKPPAQRGLQEPGPSQILKAILRLIEQRKGRNHQTWTGWS